MGYPLRFHVLLRPNVGWTELKERVVRLEALGIEVAALADHVADWTSPTFLWLETWTALPALAEATRTTRLSTVVTQIPLRHPDMLARQVLTLDHVSGDRVELGLGTGIRNDPSCAMVGVPNWGPAERVSPASRSRSTSSVDSWPMRSPPTTVATTPPTARSCPDRSRRRAHRSWSPPWDRG